MGIRQIPIGTGSLTSYFYSFKNQKLVDCESLVEMDVYLSFEFDDEIAHYESQPVEIRRSINGKMRRYFPDCLVIYTAESGRRPLLVEVKHSKDMSNPQKAEEIALKIEIFKEYAKNNGWDFKLYLDTDVRGTRLDNLKMLYKYTQAPEAISRYGDMVLTTIKEVDKLSVAETLNHITKNEKERMKILPCIWHLVRIGRLKTDLNVYLTNSSILEVPD